MPIHEDRILYQDDWFLAVQKLSGELVVKGSGGYSDTLPLLDFLKKQYPGLRPLHRLDFETSGVVVFARTKAALAAMLGGKAEESDPLPATKWKKVYRTIVAGRLDRDKGAMHFPLPARSGKGTVEAHTSFKVLERLGNATYVEVEIQTGRHHQIRKHFAKIGHPLAADLVYGDKKYNRSFIQALGYKKFFLHASAVSFLHPFTGKELTIEAPLPKTFEMVLKKLRKLAE